jgi:hypothetical protein
MAMVGIQYETLEEVPIWNPELFGSVGGSIGCSAPLGNYVIMPE